MCIRFKNKKKQRNSICNNAVSRTSEWSSSNDGYSADCRLLAEIITRLIECNKIKSLPSWCSDDPSAHAYHSAFQHYNKIFNNRQCASYKIRYSPIKISVATVREQLFPQMTSLFKAESLRQHFHFLKCTFAVTLSSLYE